MARCPSCNGARPFTYLGTAGATVFEIFGVGFRIERPTPEQIRAVWQLQTLAGALTCPDCGGSGEAIDRMAPVDARE